MIRLMPTVFAIFIALAYFLIVWGSLQIEADPQSGLALLIFVPLTAVVLVISYLTTKLVVAVIKQRAPGKIPWQKSLLAGCFSIVIAAMFFHAIQGRIAAIEFAEKREKGSLEADRAYEIAVEKIGKLVAENKGGEADVLRSAYEETNDRIMITAIMVNEFASPEMLHEYVLEKDIFAMGIVHDHPNLSAKTLDWYAENFIFSDNEKTEWGRYHIRPMLKHPNASEDLKQRLRELL